MSDGSFAATISCFLNTNLPPSEAPDISILAYFTLLSTTASIIQQGHDVTWYEDVVTEQFERRVSYYVNAESAIANGSVGLDLVLYYIRVLPLLPLRLPTDSRLSCQSTTPTASRPCWSCSGA